VLRKEVRERTKKLAVLKQLQTFFKAKHEKGVGTPFPRVPAPLLPCTYTGNVSSGMTFSFYLKQCYSLTNFLDLLNNIIGCC